MHTVCTYYRFKTHFASDATAFQAFCTLHS